MWSVVEGLCKLWFGLIGSSSDSKQTAIRVLQQQGLYKGLYNGSVRSARIQLAILLYAAFMLHHY